MSRSPSPNVKIPQGCNKGIINVLEKKMEIDNIDVANKKTLEEFIGDYLPPR